MPKHTMPMPMPKPSGLTPKQKANLPPALQKAILKKMGK